MTHNLKLLSTLGFSVLGVKGKREAPYFRHYTRPPLCFGDKAQVPKTRQVDRHCLFEAR